MEVTATKTSKLKKVFICSPFSPRGETKEEMNRDMDRNIRQAQKACRYAALRGFVPYAPHLYFTQFFDDKDADEREYGLTLCGVNPYAELIRIFLINERLLNSFLGITQSRTSAFAIL